MPCLYFLLPLILCSSSCQGIPLVQIRFAAENGNTIDEQSAEECISQLEKRLEVLGINSYQLVYLIDEQQLQLQLPAELYQEEILGYLTQDVFMELWPTYRFSDPPIQAGLKAMAADSSAQELLEQMRFPNGPNHSQAYLPKAWVSEATLAQFASYFPDADAVVPFWGLEETSEDGPATKQERIVPIYLINGVSSNIPGLPISSHDLAAASTQINYSGELDVVIEFTDNGADKFSRLTTRAAADNYRQLAIILNGIVYSAPSVRSAITGGKSVISGNFSDAESEGFAAALSSGELAVNLEVISIEVINE